MYFNWSTPLKDVLAKVKERSRREGSMGIDGTSAKLIGEVHTRCTVVA